MMFVQGFMVFSLKGRTVTKMDTRPRVAKPTRFPIVWFMLIVPLLLALAYSFLVSHVPALAPAEPSPVSASASGFLPSQFSASTPAPSNHSYTYLMPNPDGTPSRWDPCTTITWAASTSGVPASELAVVKAAFAGVSRVSGLRFRQVPAKYHPQVTLSFKSHIPDDAAGFATASARGEWLVSGRVAISRQVLDYPYPTRVALIMHELGHIVGLGHSSLKSQLMYPTVYVTTWGKYDRRGLKQVGSLQPCQAD